MRFPSCPSGRATKTLASRGLVEDSFIGCLLTSSRVIKVPYIGKAKRPQQAAGWLKFWKRKPIAVRSFNGSWLASTSLSWDNCLIQIIGMITNKTCAQMTAIPVNWFPIDKSKAKSILGKIRHWIDDFCPCLLGYKSNSNILGIKTS